jgi:ATP-binding cassette subfamily C (CFTR/MRP) protein 1
VEVTSALYASLQFCVLVEHCTVGLAKTKASIPSATLAFLASILLCIASVLEHTKSSASSFLLSFYLFTTILLDTVRIRTLWQIGELTALCLTFVAAFVAKLVLLVLESWSKRRYLDKADSEVAGEELAGFLSRSLFLWLNPLLVKGSSNFLTPPDLSPVDSALSSARLAKLFEGVNYTHYGKLP